MPLNLHIVSLTVNCSSSAPKATCNLREGNALGKEVACEVLGQEIDEVISLQMSENMKVEIEFR